MNRTAILATLLLASLTTASSIPTASAEFSPLVWEGVAEYSFSREGEIDEVRYVSPGCEVAPTFRGSRQDNAVIEPPSTAASARGSATCVPDIDPFLTKGKVPTCTATILATVQHTGATTTTGAGVVIGYAACYLNTGGSVVTYCAGAGAGNGVAFVSTPCAASATATPSSSGSCGTYLATGVNVAVSVTCLVTVVWV